MPIQERIKQYIDYKLITPYKFCKDLGLSMGYLDKKGAIGTDKYLKIIEYFPEINPDWLLTGNGEMLKNDEDKPESSDKKNLIPLYNDVATIGGVNGLSSGTDGVRNTTEYIDAGDWFPGATAAIRHYGDSMVEYPSGSILALKKVEDLRLLLWGRNYCVETTEYRVTKRLNKSKIKNHLTGYSSNNDQYPDGNYIHEPIEIPTETIRRIYQVLGCVTKEYSNGSVEIINKNS